MKKILLILNIVLASLLTIVLNGCKKERQDKISDEDQNRMFMAVFRHLKNTGKSTDPLACQVVNTNDIYLTWNGITGAAGYHIKMKIQSGSWEVPADILWDTIVGPECLKWTKTDLQYSTVHNFAIQTLSPLGEAYHSKWYGFGDGSHPDDYMSLETGERLGIPDVVSVGNVTETSLRVYFDRKVYNKGTDPSKTDGSYLNPSFKYVNENGTDKFLLDEILVEPASVNRDLPSKKIKLTAADLANGYIDVTGLSTNALYVVNGLNNGIVRYWDRLYNTTMVRMRGQVGAPILIKHVVDNTNPAAVQNNASRLDTILNQYLYDNTLAEGTVFMLEAGKKYYFGSAPILAKGLVLKSNTPGTKAIVYMGVGLNATNNGVNAFNFFLGRNAAAGEIGGVTMGDIVFNDISFELPNAVNYFNQSLYTGMGVTANYFMNQYPAAMPFTCSKFEVNNCNFQGMVRGWFRTQGSNRQVIENIVVTNCLFHDVGMYDVNGNGYSFIAGAATQGKTNLFNNVVIKNNTFAGISYAHLLAETNNRAWAPNVVWNIDIENNTFINAFANSKNHFILNFAYPPINSKFTVKKNLFVAVKAANDVRVINQSGSNFIGSSFVPGLGFDIADNYSTSIKSKDGSVTYWTSASLTEIMANNPFSASGQAGYNGGSLNVGGLAATKVINSGIAPEDLMENPFPKGRYITTSSWTPDVHLYNLNGLYFKEAAKVSSNPIYTKGIGDPRWR